MGNLLFSIHLMLLLLNQMLTSQHLEIYPIKIYDSELNSLFGEQDRELRGFFKAVDDKEFPEFLPQYLPHKTNVCYQLEV